MYKPNCDVFWVGSYPAKDPTTICKRILKNPVMLLHWPQLPKRSSRERMADQTSAALLSKTKLKAFPRGSASGWTKMLGLLKKSKTHEDRAYFKSQIAGPVTLFGKFQGYLSDKDLRRHVQLWLEHAYWQIDQIQELGFKPILVLDEPLLPTHMGAATSPRALRIVKLLKSIVLRLHKRGALVGIHCCNRVSPKVLIDLKVDLIHFDAYSFPSQVQQSKEAIQQFLKHKGIVAWGIIPVSESVASSNSSKLEKKFIDLLLGIETRGLSLREILEQSMLAPTCGTAPATSTQNDQVINLVSRISKEIKKRYKI